MATTTITIPNEEEQFDFNTFSRYADTPRKVPCLDDESVGGPCVSNPCGTCEDDMPFKYYLKPGDTIPLQYRFPDTVNEDPNNPTIGWRDTSDDWWLEVQILDLAGNVVYQGPTKNIATSAYVAASDQNGNFQVVILSADKIINLLGPLPCFKVRVRVRMHAEAAYSTVNYGGFWDMLTTFPDHTTIGTTVVNNGQGAVGYWRLTETGWVQYGTPQNGDIIYMTGASAYFIYSAGGLVVYTAHGDDGEGDFSFSRCVVGSAFTEFTAAVWDGIGTQPMGGVVTGLRSSPQDPTKVIASNKTVRRWNGVNGPYDNHEEGHSQSANGTNWTVSEGDDSGPYLPTDGRTTRVVWSKDNPGEVFTLLQGHQADGHNPRLFKSTNNGTTWASLEIELASDQEACSLLSFGGEVVVGMNSGRLYFSDAGGNAGSWAYFAPQVGPYPALGHLDGDSIIAVGQNGMYSINLTRGLDESEWLPAQAFPSIGKTWRCTDIVNQGTTVWVFGVDNHPTTPLGVLFKSVDNGSTWTYIAAAGVLGGRAALIGYNTLVATAHVFHEAGDTPLKAGTVYISTNGGTTWTAMAEQPAGGAEAVGGYTIAGTWSPTSAPGGPAPGEGDSFQSCDTYPFRVVDCEPTVHFKSGYDGVDCMGYAHDEDIDVLKLSFLPQKITTFTHEFRVKGGAEVDELPITRELAENGRFIRSTSTERVRVRTVGLPLSVVRRVQAVLASPGFTIDGKQYDTVDALRKNNEDGDYWWLDFRVGVDACKTEGSCA
jgi:photosystem II stability/assembly factor-like uncharacterized protein